MKTSLLITICLSLASLSAIAAPTCGVPTSLKVSASDVGGQGAHPYGLVSFILAGKAYSVDPTGASDGNGVVDFIDPSVVAGFVSILTIAQLNKATICFDQTALSLTLK